MKEIQETIIWNMDYLKSFLQLSCGANDLKHHLILARHSQSGSKLVLQKATIAKTSILSHKFMLLKNFRAIKSYCGVFSISHNIWSDFCYPTWNHF